MLLSKKKKDKLLYLLEKYGPTLIGVIGAAIILFLATKFELGESFGKILDSTIIFASIIVGFMGALLGILYSIRSAELLKKLFDYRENREILKSYFNECIVGGIVLVIVTAFLYLRGHLYSCILLIFASLWGFLLLYTICCTYRIVNIMMKIIFEEDPEKSEAEPVTLENNRKAELKEKYKSAE